MITTNNLYVTQGPLKSRGQYPKSPAEEAYISPTLPECLGVLAILCH